MLCRLYIKNYAIIDEVDIPFPEKLNVITGETGAGKSILLGALSLILGERSDRDTRSDKQQKTIIEGVFTLPDSAGVRAFFRENELDYDPDTLIRREISPQGKSRAFVNDTPVNLQQLGRLTSQLVDLHQQFDTLQLNRADFQLEVLDALAGNKALLAQYRETFSALTAKARELETLKREAEQGAREQDYDQFLFDELQEAAFTEDELEHLEGELASLTHAEDLKMGLAGVSQTLAEDPESVLALLRQLEGRLRGIAGFHVDIPALVGRISSAAIELDDVAAELQRIDDHISFDEERIAFIQARLDTGYRLMKKHGVQTTAALAEVQQRLEQKLDAISHAEGNLQELEAETTALRARAQELASRLTASRKAQTAGLIKKTNALLSSVGMPGASVRVEITGGELRESGADLVTFLFDANKSGNYQPIRKVASGGELSRLMLCIKSLVARSVSLPTLIFDEIDSGISGEAARQVGNIMKDLALTHQVICITHQPQIAGKADTHFEVFKHVEGGVIRTSIRMLDHEQRVSTIARMLSGERPGAAALANARELMED
jgi:DNA repair protein RecN (Recombination protein N)